MYRYESFLRASNVLVDGTGQLDTSLHRASIIAGEHRSPRGRNNRDSGAESDSRGRSRGRASTLVAFSTTESATLAGDEDVPGISSFLAACLTANFISVGYLFVPYAFATTGLVLTSVILILTMLQSYITCTYVMEACVRAELLASQADDHESEGRSPLSAAECAALVAADVGDDSDGSEPKNRTSMPISEYRTLEDALEEELENSQGSSSSDAEQHDIEKEGEVTMEDPVRSGGKVDEKREPIDVTKISQINAKSSWSKYYSSGEQQAEERKEEKRLQYKEETFLPVIRDRKFELPELSRIFLGEKWRVIFTASTCFDLYGLTWSIASVFATSLASDFSIRENQDDYVIFILIFLVIVLGMSFFSIVELVYVQLGFFLCRLIMVAIMLITVSIASTTDVAHFGEQEGPERTSPLADFRTLHVATQICIFATAFQFSVPVIAEASDDKKNIRAIYQGSTSFIAASAFGLSLVLASYFGPDLMEESSNLNWGVYNGGTGSYDEESGKMINVALWAKFISKYVLYYPAVDGISTFVLCAISLGGIIKGAWYGSAIHELKETWKQRLVFRLLGFVPQIIGAAFVRDISSM